MILPARIFRAYCCGVWTKVYGNLNFSATLFPSCIGHNCLCLNSVGPRHFAHFAVRPFQFAPQYPQVCRQTACKQFHKLTMRQYFVIPHIFKFCDANLCSAISGLHSRQVCVLPHRKKILVISRTSILLERRGADSVAHICPDGMNRGHRQLQNVHTKIPKYYAAVGSR